MTRNIEFFYEPADDARYVRTVTEQGAVVLRNFMSGNEAHLINEEIMALSFTEVDEVHNEGKPREVHEQYGAIEWPLCDAPIRTRALAERTANFVRAQRVNWMPNILRAQLYSPGGAGVTWHRDFESSLMMVAAFNIAGEAQFDVKINDVEHNFIVAPGDMVLLRNTGLHEGVDDRVEHQIHAPLNEQRLSLGLRQENISKGVTI